MAYGNSFQRDSPVVFNLIIINFIIWVAQLVFDKSFGLTERIALFPYSTEWFKPYQLVTHMFAHASYNVDGNIVISHFLFNMFSLWLFGARLERIWGPKRFLIFYLICGIAAGIAHLIMVKYGIAVGASGAIMGLAAGFAYLFPNTAFQIFPIPVPIKAKYLVAAYAVIDIFGSFSPGASNIGHFAHLGGLIMGFIIVIIWNKTNKKTFY